MNNGVQTANPQGILIINILIRNPATPEYIINQDNPTGTNQLETFFIIIWIVAFVGIDKCKVIGICGTLIEKLLQGIERRCHV